MSKFTKQLTGAQFSKAHKSLRIVANKAGNLAFIDKTSGYMGYVSSDAADLINQGVADGKTFRQVIETSCAFAVIITDDGEEIPTLMAQGTMPEALYED